MASRIIAIRHCGGCHLTDVCARNCTTHAMRFAHRFAASCVRRAAFCLAQRPGLTCLMRHSMDRRRCWISSRNQAACHSACTRILQTNAAANLVHTSSKAGTRKVNLAQNQKPLLGGREFTEKLHECSDGRRGCVGGLKGRVEEGGRLRRGESTFYAGGQLPRPNCARLPSGKSRGASITGAW